MARMYPDFDPEIELASNVGEKVAYKAIRDHTPDSWACIHGISYVTRAPWLQDGEADFVLLVPGSGILFLECKGGSKGYRFYGNRWWRHRDAGDEPMGDPAQQACRHKHQIVENVLCRSSVFGNITKSEFPHVYGHAVVFPRTNDAPPNISEIDRYDRVMFLLEDDFQPGRLEEALRNAIDAWAVNTRGKRSRLTEQGVQKVLQVLAGTRSRIPIFEACGYMEERLDALTAEQARALSIIKRQHRALVEGGAGTGKTLIALDQARSLAADDQRVLFLCYNRMLADWLAHRVKHGHSAMVSGNGHLDIINFHRFANQVVRSAGLSWPEAPDDEFWSQQVASLLMDALDEFAGHQDRRYRYDAVIVDEAQDFKADWWLPIEYLLGNGDRARLLLFRDLNQTLGNSAAEASLPSQLAGPFLLERNCRNTKQIARYIKTLASDDEAVVPDKSPEGLAVRLYSAHTQHQSRLDRVRHVLHAWLSDGVPASEIAVLTIYAQPRGNEPRRGAWDLLGTKLHGYEVIGPQSSQGPSQPLQRWMANEAMLVCPIRSFKGLEAKYVLLTDLQGADQACTESDFYVAASRAKIHLVIVPATGEGYDRAESALEPQPPRGPS